MLKGFNFRLFLAIYSRSPRNASTSLVLNQETLHTTVNQTEDLENLSQLDKTIKNSDASNENVTPWVKWWEGDNNQHPGKCNMPVIEIPEEFSKSARLYLEAFDVNTISTIGNNLDTFLFSRRLCKDRNKEVLPIFSNKIPMKYQLQEFENVVNLSKEGFQLAHNELKVRRKKENAVSYRWKQVVYDKFNAAAYLVARSPGCYASTLRVLNEIKKNVPEFNPKSILDFGSGTGTTIWAANKLWQNSLKEYVCIDSSTEMNRLSFFLYSGGDYDKHLPGVFIRQYLPISLRSEFDLVVSAYSLSEMPTQKDRLALLKTLWGKTKRYLVMIERGNFYGYYGIMEARNLLTKGLEGGNIKKTTKWKQFNNDAEIFAPCPHEGVCPMWETPKSCTMTQKYFTPIYVKKFKKKHVEKESFSYIVLEKVNKTEILKPQINNWPRVIDNPSKNPQTKCITCHLCTPGGTIEHLPISKRRHGNKLVMVAKKCQKGDLIPIQEPNDA